MSHKYHTLCTMQANLKLYTLNPEASTAAVVVPLLCPKLYVLRYVKRAHISLMHSFLVYRSQNLKLCPQGIIEIAGEAGTFASCRAQSCSVSSS